MSAMCSIICDSSDNSSRLKSPPRESVEACEEEGGKPGIPKRKRSRAVYWHTHTHRVIQQNRLASFVPLIYTSTRSHLFNEVQNDAIEYVFAPLAYFQFSISAIVALLPPYASTSGRSLSPANSCSPRSHVAVKMHTIGRSMTIRFASVVNGPVNG